MQNHRRAQWVCPRERRKRYISDHQSINLLQTHCQFELDLCLAHVTDNDDAHLVVCLGDGGVSWTDHLPDGGAEDNHLRSVGGMSAWGLSAHARTHAHTHTHTHTHTHAHAHALTHARARARAHTHTHTHALINNVPYNWQKGDNASVWRQLLLVLPTSHEPLIWYWVQDSITPK